jgi:tetratricopeptide (TPR) repeat protein
VTGPVIDPSGYLVPAERRRRRWSRVAAVMVLAGPLVGFACIVLGGLAAANGAQRDAGHYRDSGDFASAIAVYRVLGTRSGPVFLLARHQVDAAPADADRLFLAWAQSLASSGHVDEALVACDRVTLASVVGDARRTRAEIALDAARTASHQKQYDLALHRLDQVLTGQSPADLAATANSLRPQYGVAAGQALLAAGKAREAVTAFDEVISSATASPQAAQATSLLPGALLAAGRQALDAHDSATALTFLQRLVDHFAGSAAAGTARGLLQAPQPVIGTVVHRDSTPVSDIEVRLGSNYRKTGSGYLTSPPYYSARTDPRGDFTISGVPLGGNLIFEVLENGAWTTIVAPGPSGVDEPAYQVTVKPLTPVDLAFVILPD